MREIVKVKLLQNILREITIKYDKFIKQQEELLKLTYEKAVRDPLTGLYNRIYFMDFAKKYLDRAKRVNEKVVIIFLDLDNFKNVNDTLGHQKGDEILRRIGQILNSQFREYDLVSRYGGDEFVILVENIDMDNIKKRLSEMEREIENLFKSYNISISYGMAVFPEDGKNLEELLEIADKKMYDFKMKKKKLYSEKSSG